MKKIAHFSGIKLENLRENNVSGLIYLNKAVHTWKFNTTIISKKNIRATVQCKINDKTGVNKVLATTLEQAH